MRELVYLSDAKLSQFMPDRLPWWSRFRRRNPKIEVGAATLKLALDLGESVDPSRATKLDAVVAEIEKSAKWFDDPTVRPGQWVQFELPMNYDNMVWMVSKYHTPDPEPFKPGERPLLFIDCPTAGADSASRLLLHGSEQHLVGQGGTPGKFELRDVPGYSSFPQLIFWLHHLSADPLGKQPKTQGTQWGGLHILVDLLDRQHGPETASQLAGYARITGVFDSDRVWHVEPARRQRILTATPLLVERVHVDSGER